MRHMTKKHTLGKAKDQRDALLRSLATELFVHGEIKTTMARAKALKPYAEAIITLAKRGDLHAIRQAARHIYNKETGKFIRLCFLENKVKAFREIYPDRHIENFYTDSMNDKAMMDIADNVYLVKKNKITKIK